jgi:hypothetical protein
MHTKRVLALGVLLLVGCASAPQPRTEPNPAADRLWAALTPLCGQAFEGRLVEGTEPSDAEMGSQRLVMHVRACSDREIRIPFHVGENRSRTWVLTRTEAGVRLKHDHRHEDGSEDRVTQYGGDSSAMNVSPGGLALDFPADAYTANLLPAAATNIWTLAVEPGRTFSYRLRREAAGRRFGVEFDLSRPVPAPPAPW